MLRALWLLGLGAIAVGLFPERATSAPPVCDVPDKPLRYTDVKPIFEQHCAKCHDARQSSNAAAQAVFEMTSYPFSTKRPASLVGDLRGMFLHRGSLTAEEKCRGLAWLSGGALDADGKPPRWR